MITLEIEAKALSQPHRLDAELRQTRLTKPAGSLGRLETLAIRLAAMQYRNQPAADRLVIRVFAADHGIARSGVSAFPQAVTAEMVRNFSRGGAAVNVLSELLGADLKIINAGTVEALEPLAGVEDARIGPGTRDFSREAAMTEDQLGSALALGYRHAENIAAASVDLFIGGEMGIGNTSAATAMICAMHGLDAARVAGPGTGLDAEGLRRKTRTINAALDHHGLAGDAAVEILRTFGGFEIAALCGAYIGCAVNGLPVMIDGFICTAAAMAAQKLSPGSAEWFIFSHRSAEPGHRLALELVGAEPVLDLDMRLGEASGAAVATQLLRTACALHNGMATFAEAGISEKSGDQS